MLSSTQHKGYIGRRSTHNIRIESFWREDDMIVMIHFKDEFQKLETLGFLDTDSSTEMWATQCVHVSVINARIDEFK